MDPTVLCGALRPKEGLSNGHHKKASDVVFCLLRIEQAQAYICVKESTVRAVSNHRIPHPLTPPQLELQQLLLRAVGDVHFPSRAPR